LSFTFAKKYRLLPIDSPRLVLTDPLQSRKSIRYVYSIREGVPYSPEEQFILVELSLSSHFGMTNPKPLDSALTKLFTEKMFFGELSLIIMVQLAKLMLIDVNNNINNLIRYEFMIISIVKTYIEINYNKEVLSMVEIFLTNP